MRRHLLCQRYLEVSAVAERHDSDLAGSSVEHEEVNERLDEVLDLAEVVDDAAGAIDGEDDVDETALQAQRVGGCNGSVSSVLSCS